MNENPVTLEAGRLPAAEKFHSAGVIVSGR